MGSRRAVVIGGGISGVLVARELLLAGWQVTLLEAAHIGAGSSSRTAAGIRQQFSTEETVRGMRYSVDFYRHFAAEVGEVVLQQNGYLFLYQDQSSWESAISRVKLQKAAGLSEVVALENSALRAQFPWVSEAIVGGTFCPTDGFLFPALVYGEGARRVRELGGQILQSAPVTSAVHQSDRIVSVSTPKGRFEADLFLDCTNAWSPRTAKVLGGTELPISPFKRYLWFIERDGPIDRETFAKMPLIVSPSGVYCRPENANSLMMGWAHEATSEPDFSYDDQDTIAPGFAHNSGTDAMPFQAWMNMAETVPGIGEFAGVTATTSGYYGTTPDHNPFLGFDPRQRNLVRLVGFSGHGAMFGPFTALIARRLAEAGTDLTSVDVDGTPVRMDAFRIGREFSHAEAMVI